MSLILQQMYFLAHKRHTDRLLGPVPVMQSSPVGLDLDKIFMSTDHLALYLSWSPVQLDWTWTRSSCRQTAWPCTCHEVGLDLDQTFMSTDHLALNLSCSAIQLDWTWRRPSCRQTTWPCTWYKGQSSWTRSGSNLHVNRPLGPLPVMKCSPVGLDLDLKCSPVGLDLNQTLPVDRPLGPVFVMKCSPVGLDLDQTLMLTDHLALHLT